MPAEEPTIVSVSDIHGFIREGRSALLTLSDHPEYDPIVETGRLRRLEWVGGDEYVLVVNGDLIDRGAHSDKVLETVERLAEQAPPGHVRVTLGNHEMGMLTPDFFEWGDWYSMSRTDDQRREFARAIEDGHVVAAYDGYNVTYAHAGQPEPYETPALNEELRAGATYLAEGIGQTDDPDRQRELVVEYPAVYGVDGGTGRGPNAGIAWLDFEHMPADAPPQVVGHTRQTRPVRRGNVVCENVIRGNRRSDGGEAVVVETPDGLSALARTPDDTVSEREFSLPVLE
nr:metallophosphoesterase [Halovenus carboxidivorans]